MPLASFRTSSNPTSERIDSAAGIIYGCQLVKNGKTAVFAGKGGKVEEIDITPDLIKRLAELATGRSLTAHWTHDYRADNVDPLQYKIGAWKNVRVDTTGNLIGDLHLMPSEYKDAVLWLAENTPDGAMMSVVFSYDRVGARHASPVEFYGADLVEIGAGTEAFFSKPKPQDKPMEPKQLVDSILGDEEAKKALFSAMLTDPTVKTQLAVMAKAEDKDDDKDDDEPVTEEDEATLSKAQGVTDEDKKPEDAKLSRFTRVIVQGARAKDRQIAAMADSAKVAAMADLTKRIGNTGLPQDLGQGQDKGKKQHAFLAKVEANVATGVSASKAMLRAQNDHPDLYNDYIKNKGIFQTKA